MSVVALISSSEGKINGIQSEKIVLLTEINISECEIK